MTLVSRLLYIAAAVTALSATGCGGEKTAITTNAAHRDSSGSVKSVPTTDTGKHPDGPVNPPYLEKKLEAGECEAVASETNEILARSENSTDLAEARLFHALAIACLGNDAAVELDQAEGSRSLLSSDSVEILDRVQAEGVPRTRAQVRALLPRRTTKTATATATEQP